VSRAEIELPPATDPHSKEVYDRAAENFAALRRSALVLEDAPSIYLYRLRIGDHTQTGIAACYSLDEYDRDVIKKHERTRRDKEDDRTTHMLALGAQTGPVFLTYVARPEIDRIVAAATATEPLIDFEAVDRVRHTLWRVCGSRADNLVEAAKAVPALYIADGHHRAASASRARVEMQRGVPTNAAGDPLDRATFLAVAFPHNQVRILAYNRAVRDLGGLSADDFARAVRDKFEVEAGPATSAREGEIGMYFQGTWHRLRSRRLSLPGRSIAALDVSVLQDELLAPILKIADVRTDPRIAFVGGAKGTAELAALVDSGRAAVAFSLHPVSVGDLMTVSNEGGIMPPKSTWFEPKLRDGLLIHLI
jgi:uncharacterized protein (DUF1015 family)